MPRPRNHVPTYRLHKQSGQAIVTLNANGTRRDVLLGKYGSPESRTEYQRVIAELNASGPTAVTARAAGSDLTISDVLLAFMEHAAVYSRTPDGKPTSEVRELKLSISPVRQLYGLTLAAEFGPVALEATRRQMIDADLCRKLINRRIDRIKRVFRWAASKGLVPVTVYQSLQTLAGLRAGRTQARESSPVKPVDPAHVTATLPFVNRHLRAMVELQRLTGMRPGEAWKMIFGEVDCSGERWFYRSTQHKTAYHGKDRVIPLGPRAQRVLVAFLIGDNPPPTGFDQIDLTDHTARLVAADAIRKPAASGMQCCSVTSADGRAC